MSAMCVSARTGFFLRLTLPVLKGVSDKWLIVVRTDLTRRRESDLYELEEYPRRTLCAECEYVS